MWLSTLVLAAAFFCADAAFFSGGGTGGGPSPPPAKLAGAADAERKGVTSGACPPGDYTCADGSGCCPTGTICGTGSKADFCLLNPCPSGDFACADGSGCCPNGRTCGTGSQSNLCLSGSGSSSALPAWAISLIVILPLSCLAACCRYQMQRTASAASADSYNAVPSTNPAFAGQASTYNAAPSFQAPPASAPPGSAYPQQWK
jgi:hypothetical protein